MTELRDRLRRFADERDWDQYHSPKNLASALVVEAGELLEHFQWLTESASSKLNDTERAAVAEEIADVFVYLIRLADKLDLNLIDEAHKKIDRNAANYPIDRARGNSRKYTEL